MWSLNPFFNFNFLKEILLKTLKIVARDIIQSYLHIIYQSPTIILLTI